MSKAKSSSSDAKSRRTGKQSKAANSDSDAEKLFQAYRKKWERRYIAMSPTLADHFRSRLARVLKNKPLSDTLLAIDALFKQWWILDPVDFLENKVLYAGVVTPLVSAHVEKQRERKRTMRIVRGLRKQFAEMRLSADPRATLQAGPMRSGSGLLKLLS